MAIFLCAWNIFKFTHRKVAPFKRKMLGRSSDLARQTRRARLGVNDAQISGELRLALFASMEVFEWREMVKDMAGWV